MGLDTSNSGFKTVNVSSDWGISGNLVRVYGVDFSSATKQVLFEIYQRFGCYFTSGTLYAQNNAGKGETNGVWTASLSGKTRADDVNSFYIVYWPLNTSVQPSFDINGERLTVTTSVTPTAVQAITGRIHYFGADSNNDSRLQGSIEEIAYFQQSLGYQPTTEQIWAMTKSTVRGYPLLLDGCEMYFACNEVPDGAVACSYENVRPSSDVNTDWAVSTGTSRYEAIDDDLGTGTDYIYANDADDNLNQVCKLTAWTIPAGKFVTGFRLNSDVSSPDSLTFLTALYYGFIIITSLSHSSSTRAISRGYIQNFATQAVLDLLWYVADAPTTIDKGSEGGRVYAGNVDIFYNNYELPNKVTGKFATANQLIGFGVNAVGNVTGTIDRLRNN